MANPSNGGTQGSRPHPVEHDPRDNPQRRPPEREPAPRAGDVRTGVVSSDPESGRVSPGTVAAPQTAIGAERPPEAQAATGRDSPERDPMVQPSPAQTAAMQSRSQKQSGTPLLFALVVLALVVLVALVALML
ncbi:MAG: hypothetical protein ACLFTP_08270 [Rhodosalinus sp.]